MPDSVYDVVVVGGGHAGLSVSYMLNQHGLRHVVLERGRIGESWRSQRWNSFKLNTPNRFNNLPGDDYYGPEPDAFITGAAFASYLEGYAHRFRLPVQERARVVSVQRNASHYHVAAFLEGKARTYECRQIVVASGGMNELTRPAFASTIPPDIRQCHAGEYRSAAGLPDGAVLVVGSAQSGMQVAEDLIEAGRKVYLSTSAVGRFPRRYRGKDILEWLFRMGFYDTKTDDVSDPRELRARQPQISGLGPLGHTLSLQWLAKRGAVILGKIDGASGTVLSVQPNAADHVRFADEVSEKVKGKIEEYIAANALTAPPVEPDPADEPDKNCSCVSAMTSIDLQKEGIRSIVWATGFSSDLSYLKDRVVDAGGRPVHRNGISGVAGLYFLGLPWLRKRKSGTIPGIAEDAAFIAERLNSGRLG
jgi:putative flavoprotein involved in K+ transport